jgi:hypothetical protein
MSFDPLAFNLSLFSSFSTRGGKLERPAHQFNRVVDIGLGFEEETDPTAIWQNMMRLRLATADQLIPDRLGEWDIDQTVAMNMAELPFP